VTESDDTISQASNGSQIPPKGGTANESSDTIAHQSDGQSLGRDTPRTPADGSEEGHDYQNTAPLYRGRRFLVAAVLLCGAVITVAFIFRGMRTETSISNAVPATDLTPVSDAVRRNILRAQQQVIERPGSAESWGQLGLVLLAHEFDRDASVCFQKAVSLSPKDFRWHYYCGLSSGAEDRALAIASFRRACELRPDRSIAHARLGELLLAAEDLEGADDHLQAAVANEGFPAPRTLQALARLRLIQTRLDEAQALIEKAQQSEPDSRMLLEVLARIQQARGDRDSARTTLQMMQQLPDDPLLWLDPWAAAALQLKTDSGGIHKNIQVLIERGDLFAAIARLKRMINEPEAASTEVWLQLADLLRQTGQSQEAIDLLHQFLIRDPDNARGRMRMGVLLAEREDWEAAAVQFSTVAKLLPDHFQARLNLAQCLLKVDDEVRATEALIEALAIMPEHCGGRLLLVRQFMNRQQCTEALHHLDLASRCCGDSAEFLALKDEVKRNCDAADASKCPR
jgi:tetratricopeptide (TPR) repeat protein